jgi:hypothetical protein
MSNQRDNQNRLPIKVILPEQGKERRVSGGGAPPTPFRDVTDDYRKSLVTQVSAIRDSVSEETFNSARKIPLRIKVISKAVAKSHRPDYIFQNTCPIVGAGALGELFLKGSKEGLNKLIDTIENNQSARTIKELSSIEIIEPITPNLRRNGVKAVDILRKSPRREKGFLTRVKLFDFGPADQEIIVKDFKNSCKVIDTLVRQIGYGENSFTYEVECESVEQLEALSRVVGIRNISPMPVLRTIRLHIANLQPLAQNLPSAEVTDRDFPIVAVVDTGIDSLNTNLGSWVIGKESFVAPQFRNPTHGTFVAGLICWGGHLNPNLKGISTAPCGVFDVEVLPNGDPNYGSTDSICESELLQSLETALKKHSNEIKVWNLSLGSDEVCSFEDFSTFAKEVDDLQEKYNVSFVISSGNYTSSPLLDYPRLETQLNDGRITSPADSVLGITVGAISHIDYAAKGPQLDTLSPFSRHGPGPNHIIKPDLVHYGGTCSVDRSHVAGIRSVHGNDSGEDIGTSFSAPLVARALAETYHHITPTPSPVLARALLTHHARDPRSGARVPDGEEDYLGFGLPKPPPYCLECTPYTSTLVFEDCLRPGYFLEWDDFPYPASLKRNGKYYGQVWMTVAFSPVRGSQWGTEYCETHVEASFGVYRDKINSRTGEVKEVFNGLVPAEHKNPGRMYESHQIRELRKWAPVRTYYGDLGKRGEKGNRWRLKLQLLTRHGIDRDPQIKKSQPFSLIITIADPDQQAPVYDEMAQVVRNRFQAENLIIRSSIQIKTNNG